MTVLVAGDPALEAALRVPDSELLEEVGRVPTGHEAMAVAVTDLPDVLLLDTRIQHADAGAVCRRIREWAPATRIVTATPSDDELAYSTLVAGASSAVATDADAATLVATIRRAARGEAVLLPRMARRLIHDLDSWAARRADPLYPPPTLTATEREVLTLLGAGDTAEEIAATHSVTAHLVNLHAGFAITKLHRYVLGAEQIAAAE